MASGVPNSEIRNATTAATMTALTSDPSSEPAAESATSHVRYREPFTRTTSPGRNSSRSSATAAS